MVEVPFSGSEKRGRYNSPMAASSDLDRLLDPLTEAFTPKVAAALLELCAESELEAGEGAPLPCQAIRVAWNVQATRWRLPNRSAIASMSLCNFCSSESWESQKWVGMSNTSNGSDVPSCAVVRISLPSACAYPSS